MEWNPEHNPCQFELLASGWQKSLNSSENIFVALMIQNVWVTLHNGTANVSNCLHFTGIVINLQNSRS